MNILHNLPIQDWHVYVSMSAYAVASAMLVLLGIVLGQRMTNPKHIFPTASLITLICAVLFITPFGAVAPGFFLTVLIGFEASTWLVNIASGKAKESKAKSSSSSSTTAK